MQGIWSKACGLRNFEYLVVCRSVRAASLCTKMGRVFGGQHFYKIEISAKKARTDQDNVP